MQNMSNHTIQLRIIRKAPVTTEIITNNQQTKNKLKGIQINNQHTQNQSKNTNKIMITNHGQEQKEPKTWYSEQPNKEAKQPNYSNNLLQQLTPIQEPHLSQHNS